jgi:phosphoribosylaminoimidazolecarboxamide formyltransferase/IMP cyclohydrolase
MRAILSVSDKSGLLDFARGLVSRGVQLVSTGGTAKAIAEAGLPVTNVSDVTGFPEMMDGRVKTLHPKIHGGILARRHRPDDLEAIRSQGVELVDLVVVNLYPFAKAAQNPETPFDELVEQIDIGGPSLLRAAGKNFRDVMVVVDPADYPRVLEQMARSGGPSLEFKFELMQKAFAHTAQFDVLIAQTLSTIQCSGDAFVRHLAPTGGSALQIKALRYGENPHQKAHWIQGHGPNWRIRWETHQGKELSFTNLLDLDAAARIVLEFTEPAATVIKHTNPCGTATGAGIAEAYVRARDADPLSAFGGIVGLNREIDGETAKALTSTFIEAVIAPSFTAEAKDILARKQNMRVVTADFAAMANVPTVMGSGEHALGTDIRTILGGTLHQEPDRVTEAREPWGPPSPPAAASAGSGPSGPSPDGQIRVVTKRQPTAEEWQALRFAWRVCAHVKSNTIIFTGVDRSLAVGAGQMSRVDAVKVAVMKAPPGSLEGSVVASDAFFPFRDGLDALADAGATAVVQPGGSVKDAEVIAAADERGLAMVFTGRRHFRH